MGKFIVKESDWVQCDKRMAFSQPKYDSFNTSLLGLGDIKADSKSSDAIAAFFDLEGFTNFSKQIEPHLSVPLFLSSFLGWLLDAIKQAVTEEKVPQGVKMWGPLPFFVKFMGDGLLVLWDLADTNEYARLNIVVGMERICRDYKKEFLPTMTGRVVDPPPALRCGLARGMVYSVGDGNDYVGSCINMAARLQKIPGTTFAVNRRGFDLEQMKPEHAFRKKIVIVQCPLEVWGSASWLSF
ncbi:MAG: hypothetical protein SF051_10225 [Elusimicrobiota bacterium]|nr:hypothetical protein [Elusimicrobiota bacterium]